MVFVFHLLAVNWGGSNRKVQEVGKGTQKGSSVDEQLERVSFKICNVSNICIFDKYLRDNNLLKKTYGCKYNFGQIYPFCHYIINYKADLNPLLEKNFRILISRIWDFEIFFKKSFHSKLVRSTPCSLSTNWYLHFIFFTPWIHFLCISETTEKFSLCKFELMCTRKMCWTQYYYVLKCVLKNPKTELHVFNVFDNRVSSIIISWSLQVWCQCQVCQRWKEWRNTSMQWEIRQVLSLQSKL